MSGDVVVDLLQACSFNHRVGAGEQLVWNLEAERLSRPKDDN
jgi:hypothetical protein